MHVAAWGCPTFSCLESSRANAVPACKWIAGSQPLTLSGESCPSAQQQVLGSTAAADDLPTCTLLQAGLESVAPTEITLSPRPEDAPISVTCFSAPRRLRRLSPERHGGLALANGGLPSPVPEERPEAAMQFVGVLYLLIHSSVLLFLPMRHHCPRSAECILVPAIKVHCKGVQRQMAQLWHIIGSGSLCFHRLAAGPAGRHQEPAAEPGPGAASRPGSAPGPEASVSLTPHRQGFVDDQARYKHPAVRRG
jgi:hypothetical protein